jgi:5-methyltetrahydrofolate--homocysteine methyltransferase
MDELFPQLREAVVDGATSEATAAVEQALAGGAAPGVVLDQLTAAMAEVGRLFECGDFYPPEMLIAARAMQACLAVLKPHLSTAGAQAAGQVIIGTVQGDLHDIGKNLVGLMLEGAGFQIHDLGTGVPPAKFVAAIQAALEAGGVDILALSALLTTTMPHMKRTIDALAAAGLRDQIKVIVGGAPVTAHFAEQIGADGYAPDAARAVAMVRGLLAHAPEAKPAA